MSRPDAKKRKLDVAQAGSGPALTHNPFGALGGAEAAPPVQRGSEASTSTTTTNAEPSPPAKSRGRLVLRREKKGRGGKTVVVVVGLRADAHLPESAIALIAQELKQQLGCGGSVERVPSDTIIVLQGDRPARVAELLRAQGFRVDGVTQ